MAAFDYSTAKPLMDAVNTAWRGYKGESDLVLQELANSCVKPWFDTAGGVAANTELNTAIQALSDYIDTLAPQ